MLQSHSSSLRTSKSVWIHAVTTPSWIRLFHSSGFFKTYITNMIIKLSLPECKLLNLKLGNIVKFQLKNTNRTHGFQPFCKRMASVFHFTPIQWSVQTTFTKGWEAEMHLPRGKGQQLDTVTTRDSLAVAKHYQKKKVPPPRKFTWHRKGGPFQWSPHHRPPTAPKKQARTKEQTGSITLKGK